MYLNIYCQCLSQYFPLFNVAITNPLQCLDLFYFTCERCFYFVFTKSSLDAFPDCRQLRVPGSDLSRDWSHWDRSSAAGLDPVRHID